MGLAEIDLEPTFTDQLGNQMGQTATVRFSNDILRTDGTVETYDLAKWVFQGVDYMFDSGYPFDSNTETGKYYDIVWESSNSSYPTSVNGLGYTGFLEHIYKITNEHFSFTNQFPDRTSIGNINTQGAGQETFSNSSTGETTDNDERFIQLISRTGNICEVYIFAYINGELNYLEGQNEGQVGYHPTSLDPNVHPGMVGQPLWYPVYNQLWAATNSNAKWTMTIQP